MRKVWDYLHNFFSWKPYPSTVLKDQLNEAKIKYLEFSKQAASCKEAEEFYKKEITRLSKLLKEGF